MPDTVRAGILFPEDDCVALAGQPPAHFRDLNLDQVVDTLTSGREEHDLAAWYWTPLPEAELVAYRQVVVDDLQRPPVREAVTSFAERMREVRRLLGRTGPRRYRLEAAGWFLKSVETYCDAIERVVDALEDADPGSRGLCGARDRLGSYARSEAFTSLQSDARTVRAQLDEVRYGVTVKGARVTVSRFEGEPDAGAQVRSTFARFEEEGGDAEYRARWRLAAEMDHVEARVLELVARLHPAAFDALGALRERHEAFLADLVADFDRELQFYLAYLDLIAPLQEAGLAFCRPVVADGKETRVEGTFDLALAGKLLREGGAVVGNDVVLSDPERILVVTGPNQGGKTTFARTFGQLHHLAALGLPVPGASARLPLCDAVYTHFEREEAPATMHGKLEDDLVRLHDILARASPASVLVLNETFGSTTLHDARVLGAAVLERIVDLDALCVYVTFVDELASVGDTTVSIVAGVVPEDPARRTFRLERRPADGLAYARVLAERHGLTAARILERVPA